MRITVNLASRPFVELRPFFLRLRILMGALALAVIGLALLVHAKSKELRKAEDQMAALQTATARAQHEKASNEARMRQPANAEVLDRAHFLNALFLRKSFSWTAVMMDLENVLPVGVQVTSIEPQVTAEGDVIIRLRVAGDRDKAVQLVRNLERSKRFLQPRLAGETSQAKEGAQQQRINPNLPAGVEFDILADYNPLPANEAFHYPKARPLPASAMPAAPTPARPAAGYPRNGVVLPPYPARPNVPASQPAQNFPSANRPSLPQRRPFGPGMPQPGQGGPR